MSIHADRKAKVAAKLGHFCHYCGCMGVWPWEDRSGFFPSFFALPTLQVEHKDGRKWAIRRPNSRTRWKRYLAEVKKGKCVAACAACNRKHGAHRRYQVVEKSRQGGKRRPIAARRLDAMLGALAEWQWGPQGTGAQHGRVEIPAEFYIVGPEKTLAEVAQEMTGELYHL